MNQRHAPPPISTGDQGLLPFQGASLPSKSQEGLWSCEPWAAWSGSMAHGMGLFKYWCWLSPVTWGRSYHCYHGYHVRDWRPMVLALALTLQITEPSRTRVSSSEEQFNPCSAASRGCYKDQVSKGTRKSQLPLLSESTVLLQMSTLVKWD